MKRLFILVAGLALLVSSAAGLAAVRIVDDVPGRAAPLTTVALRLEGIPRELKTWDVSEQTLKAALAERLAASGIRVIDLSELAQHPEAGVIRLRLVLTRAPYQFYLYGLNLSLRERLAVSRDDAFTTVKTWSETQNGMLMPKDAGDIKRISLELLEKLLHYHGRG